MPQPALKIEIKGLDKFMKAMERFPKKVMKNWSAAGKEAADDIILPTEGLQNYPPETAANLPPAPYYHRGEGTQTLSGNYGNSERLGTKWDVTRQGFSTSISNPVSYARYLHGEEQAAAMADIGWKKLYDTAKKKLSRIQKVYQAWVDKTLREVGLK